MPSGKSVSFTVFAEPVAKGRPRFAKRGSFVRVYTPVKTLGFEKAVGLEAARHFPEPWAGPVTVGITFYVQKPQRLARAREAPHDKRPDLDNFLKSVLDGLNGVAFLDDAQVYRLIAEKWYSDRPRIEVTVEQP